MSRSLRALFVALGVLVALVAGGLGRDLFRTEGPPEVVPGDVREASGHVRTPIGARIAPFEFVDVRYLPRGLTELGPHAAFVIAFTSVTCPISERYLPQLRDLERQYRDRGVQFLSVNVGPDSIAEAAAQAAQVGLDFPVVKDFTGEAVAALGVRRTPGVVVLDADWVLRYRGRIDDGVRFGGIQRSVEEPHLGNALEDVLAGRAVRTAETTVEGCVITIHRAEPDPELTWSADVAPLVREHCARCHHTGGVAPFALQTWNDVAARSAMIEEVVEQQRMPPWFASPAHADLANVEVLAAGERDTLLSWLRAGAPRGELEPGESPPAATERERGWRIDPDLILSADAELVIPSSGYFPYQVMDLTHVFEEDTWVDGIEILPSNARVLHHAFASARSRRGSGEGSLVESYLNIFVPGSDPTLLDPGVAMKIPKGARVRLQLHYTPTGREERDRVSIGFQFPKGVVRRQLRSFEIRDHAFEIPALHPAFPVQASRKTGDAITLYSAVAHMHGRGKDMILSSTLPDGTRETLLVIGNYSFDWQREYSWKRGAKQFPKGTLFDVVARFDNSAFNPYNPDPSVPVGFGRMTDDEMMYCWMFFTKDRENLHLRIDPRTGRVLRAPR